TSSSVWQNFQLPAPQSSTFAVAYDATPNGTGVDAVTGLSNGLATAYTSLAVIGRFNVSGFIDAINGPGYQAVNPLPSTPGATYHFRLVVNIPAHTYSLYVKPPTPPQTALAPNHAFRPDQNTVATLNTWSVAPP